MSSFEGQREFVSPAADFHMLGTVSLDDCLALQRRLVYEAGGRSEGRITVLMCEHPEIITVGRGGSRGDIRLSPEELRERRIEVRWLGRGGGCIVHCPGQLAVYPIAPLGDFGWTVGEYLRRLQRGLEDALAELGAAAQSRPGRFGVWGRTGQLAAVGAAVQYGVAWQGAFVNVNPVSRAVRFVETCPARWNRRSTNFGPNGSGANGSGASAGAAADKPEMSSLLTERGRPAKMTRVRTALVTALSSAWGCERYHLFTGHPFLTSSSRAAS